MKKKLELFQRFDSQPINFKQNTTGTTYLRLYLFSAGIAFLFLALFIRLFQLTVVKGAYYRFVAENNRIKEVLVEAPRGNIVDRKGLPLVTNKKQNNEKQPYYRIYHLAEATSHMLGYRTLANKDDVTNDTCKQPLLYTDRVGKSGVDKVFECELRGK